MSWNPDREPVEYLQRRLKYYKKRLGYLRKAATRTLSEHEIKYLGGQKRYRAAVKAATERVALRIEQFTEAIKKLTNVTKEL